MRLHKEKLYTITKNLYVAQLYKLALDCDKIEAEIIGYGLDYSSEWTEAELKDMPEIMKNMPVSDTMEVTEEEFKEFLSRHISDFDITDNINAQVPAYQII